MEDFGVLWVYGFCGDSRGFFCWYGMGAGTEMQSERQPGCNTSLTPFGRTLATPLLRLARPPAPPLLSPLSTNRLKDGVLIVRRVGGSATGAARRICRRGN